MADTEIEKLHGSHPVATDARLAVGEQLQELLVDLVDLSLQAKQAHWNVIGSRFRSIHEQMDDLTSAARDWSDRVAERLLGLGIAADGRAATVARDSRLPPFPEGRVADSRVVELMTERLLETVRRARRRLGELGEQDLISQDLVVEVVAGLEKQLWMLQATASRP
ncbi:MAG TPA: DNA starvation/stationary phase protection protein [Candidatus Dormibacteraeota bacterium]|nr:DNA starvation/stationary phase protection protein [Candidatus Dormibacteraeota bacterium]